MNRKFHRPAHVRGVRAGFLLAGLGGCTFLAYAQDAKLPEAPDLPEWACKYCPFESGFEGALDLGAAYVSDNAFGFGNYTGFDRAGPYLFGNAELHRRSDASINLDFRAEDLGVDSRVLSLDAGRPGHYGFHVGYRGSPRLWDDGAQTPFLRLDGGELGLPSGWTTAGTTGAMSNLDASLHPFDWRLDRRRIDLGAAFMPGRGPEYRVNFSREQRSGTQVMGGTFLTQGSLLPRLVDDVTEQLELSAALQKPAWQWRGVYQGSFYRNATDFLGWQNPYDPLSPGASRGRLALAPDNQSHQLSTALASQAVPGTSISGRLAAGRILQSAALGSATENPNLAEPLPRSDSGGRVDTLSGTLRSGTRLTKSLRLDLEYRFRERDNRTPAALYPQVQTDVFAADPRVNRPHQFTDQLFKLSLNQRLPAGIRLAAGYDGTATRREQLAVDRATENSVWGRINLYPSERSNLEVRLARGYRDGPAPHALDSGAPPENPRLRQFNLADRNRSVMTVRWTTLQDEHWSYGAGVDYSHDKYSGTEVGLKDGRELNLNADLAWTPTPDRAVTAYAGHGRIRTMQAGSRTYSSPDWWADNRDESHTLSLNLEQRNVVGALDLSANFTFVNSRGRTILDDGGQARPFPDVDSRLQGLGLLGNYRLSQNLSLSLGLRHERYRVDDWQRDGVDVDTVPNLLGTGLETPDYRVNLVYLSLRWQLGGAGPGVGG